MVKVLVASYACAAAAYRLVKYAFHVYTTIGISFQGELLLMKSEAMSGIDRDVVAVFEHTVS